ncbi:MAG: 3-dehydroquinate synthase [Waddliaceae bacterium]|nr:3-dehydroquinate synthase [Waddliaceae bacterium]
MRQLFSLENILENTHLAEICQNLASRAVIITDSNVEKLYGKAIKKALDAPIIAFPAGEQSKTRVTKEMIEDQMLESGMGRDSCIVALGGGVVTDLAGYVAATYCRGIPFLSIPTTLLAMVDASIGGKTGVNVPQGKNLIGAFHPAHSIIIDVKFLRTLSLDEYRNGLAEVVKHGLICDLEYFSEIEAHLDEIMARDEARLQSIVKRSYEIKSGIVSADEKEAGFRRILNFGHTIAHAIEIVSDYKISHGHAVAIGCIVEAFQAMRLGHLDQDEFLRIVWVFKALGFPLDLQLSPEPLLKVMGMDKKSLKGVPRFVMLEELGKVLPFDGEFCTTLSPELVEDALQWMCHDLPRY